MVDVVPYQFWHPHCWRWRHHHHSHDKLTPNENCNGQESQLSLTAGGVGGRRESKDNSLVEWRSGRASPRRRTVAENDHKRPPRMRSSHPAGHPGRVQTCGISLLESTTTYLRWEIWRTGPFRFDENASQHIQTGVYNPGSLQLSKHNMPELNQSQPEIWHIMACLQGDHPGAGRLFHSLLCTALTEGICFSGVGCARGLSVASEKKNGGNSH